jgi:hypothetical protein
VRGNWKVWWIVLRFGGPWVQRGPQTGVGWALKNCEKFIFLLFMRSDIYTYYSPFQLYKISKDHTLVIGKAV